MNPNILANPLVFSVPQIGLAPLLQTAALQAPAHETHDSSSFLSNHIELAAFGATLIAAGLGAGLLLWKRRASLPDDGTPRTPSQIKAFQEASRWGKALSGTDKHRRRAAVQGLVGIVPALAHLDRSRVIRRVAIQFCMEWRWIIEDPKVEKAIRDKIIRWPKPLLEELTERLSERLEDRQSNLQANARAALKNFHGK